MREATLEEHLDNIIDHLASDDDQWNSDNLKEWKERWLEEMKKKTEKS